MLRFVIIFGVLVSGALSGYGKVFENASTQGPLYVSAEELADLENLKNEAKKFHKNFDRFKPRNDIKLADIDPQKIPPSLKTPSSLKSASEQLGDLYDQPKTQTPQISEWQDEYIVWDGSDERLISKAKTQTPQISEWQDEYIVWDESDERPVSKDQKPEGVQDESPKRVHEPQPSDAHQAAPVQSSKSPGSMSFFETLANVANKVSGQELIDPKVAGQLGESAKGTLSPSPH